MEEIDNAREFVSGAVDGANMVLSVVDMIRERWMEVLENDRDFSDAIAGAEAMKTEVITGSYPQIVTSMFSQPPITEEPGDGETIDGETVDGMTLADRLDEEEATPRAGRGR